MDEDDRGRADTTRPLPHLDQNVSVPEPVAGWVRRTLDSERPVAARRVHTGDNSTVVELHAGRPGPAVHPGGDRWFLKHAPSLRSEHDRLTLLTGRLPIPAPLGLLHAHGHDWLLTTALPGTDLTDPEHLRNPARLVRLLAGALHLVHAVNPTDCPFTASPAPAVPPAGPWHAPVLVHGDACLPNILADDHSVTGLVDLGGTGLGPREVDLAAALWSLRRNLGPGWERPFLDAYGAGPLDDRRIEALRRAYQDM